MGRLSQNLAKRLPFPGPGAGEVEDPGESVRSALYCDGLAPDVLEEVMYEEVGVGVSRPFDEARLDDVVTSDEFVEKVFDGTRGM